MTASALPPPIPRKLRALRWMKMGAACIAFYAISMMLARLGEWFFLIHFASIFGLVFGVPALLAGALLYVWPGGKPQ